MKYSTGVKALSAFVGITTLVGLGLTGVSIGFATHSMVTRTATLLPTLATGTGSQVVMVLTGTTILAIGLMAAFLLYEGWTTLNSTTTLKTDDIPGLLALTMISIALVMGFGYGAAHLGIRPSLASSYSGLALSGIEAACGASMAAITPLAITVVTLKENGLDKNAKGWVATTIVAVLTGAGSALAGPALASLIGAIGSEAIAVECMTALVLSMVPAGVLLTTARNT